MPLDPITCLFIEPLRSPVQWYRNGSTTQHDSPDPEGLQIIRYSVMSYMYLISLDETGAVAISCYGKLEIDLISWFDSQRFNVQIVRNQCRREVD